MYICIYVHIYIFHIAQLPPPWIQEWGWQFQIIGHQGYIFDALPAYCPPGGVGLAV